MQNPSPSPKEGKETDATKVNAFCQPRPQTKSVTIKGEGGGTVKVAGGMVLKGC